jgi:CRP/FNR family transcriptional regulator
MDTNLAVAIDPEPYGAVDGQVSGIRSLVSYSVGKTVLFEGDRTKHFFEIIKGVMKHYKLLPDGRRQVTGFLYPGSYFGLTVGDRVAYTAEAVTDVRLWRYSRAGFERLMEHTRGSGQPLLEMVISELHTAQDQMLLLGRMTAQERIAAFLLTLAQRSEAHGRRASQVHLPMNRSDIADYVGLATETVSRSLAQLKRQGIINMLGHQNVTILSLDRLRQIAEGEEVSRLAVRSA